MSKKKSVEFIEEGEKSGEGVGKGMKNDRKVKVK